jgi:hypothetical protein
MLENSSVLKTEVPVVDPLCLSDQELRFLAMFRRINDQRQNDILRVMEAFWQLPD